MEIKGKKVLVTGAGGFIGSHLVEKLVEIGAHVRAFVMYTSTGTLENLDVIPREVLSKIEIVYGDLRSIESVRKAVKGCEVIFHLGALISIAYSYHDPLDFVQTNVLGTFNILQASKEFEIKKIIITSTSEVYGTALFSPINEEHPLQAQSPYSATKISADKLAESFYKSYNTPVAIIRPFNTYGPRQSIRAVIPTIIYQTITQDKIKIGSLAPKRDFTFVKDTVEGFIKVAESENSIGETINIGSGKTISIGDLANTIQKILGKSLIIETDEKKVRPDKSEVNLLLCDNSKAKKLIGWEPKVSLEEGLEECISYVKNNLNKYKFELGIQYL